MHGKARRCRRRGCKVTLSRYNQGDLCWRHRQERQRAMFLRGIDGQDTLTAAERRRYLKGEW